MKINKIQGISEENISQYNILGDDFARTLKEWTDKQANIQEKGEIARGASTPLFRNTLNGSVGRFNEGLDDLKQATELQMNDLAILAQTMLTTEMDFIDACEINPQIYEAKENVWEEIQKESEDPEIVDIADDMNVLEAEIIDHKNENQVDQSYIEASQVIRNTEYINNDNQKSDKDLSISLQEAIKANLSVDELIALEQIMKEQEENEKLSSDIPENIKNMDLHNLLIKTRKDLIKTQKLLNILEAQQAEQSANTMKACKEKSSPLLSRVKSDVTRFGRDTCAKTGAILKEAYESAGDVYRNISKETKKAREELSKVHELRKEKLSFGFYSYSKQKKYLKKFERENDNNKENLTPAKKILNGVDSFIDKHFNKAEASARGNYLKYVEFESDAWKDNESPVHKAQRKAEETKDSFINAFHSIGPAVQKARKEISETINNKVNNFVENTKKNFSLAELKIKKKIKETQINSLSKTTSHIEKTQKRIMKKIKQYSTVDETVTKSLDQINKALQSLTSITPVTAEKIEHKEISKEMQTKIELLNRYQNIAGTKKIKALAESIKEYKKEEKMVKKENKSIDRQNKRNEIKAGIKETSQKVINPIKTAGYKVQETILNEAKDESETKVKDLISRLQAVINNKDDIADKTEDKQTELNKINEKINKLSNTVEKDETEEERE